MNTTKGLSDMTADERLVRARALANRGSGVDWVAVRRATALPVSERSDEDQDLVDAYAN